MNESSVELKKADGSPIKFNFQLPNGLPVKTILIPPFDIFKSKKDESFFIHITYLFYCTVYFLLSYAFGIFNGAARRSRPLKKTFSQRHLTKRE